MAPIPHIRGAGALLNAVIESTFGTSQTAASYSLRVESIEASMGASRPQIRALGQGSKGFQGPTFVESQTASFSLRIVAHYTVDGLATLLRWILWGTWGTTGSGPYAHTLTTGGSRIGATMRFNTGTAVGSANDEAVTLVGATVFTASIRVSAPGLMTVEVTGEALSFSRSNTAHSLAAAATTETPVIHHHAGTLAWNSITATLNTFTINVNNALTAVYRMGDLGPGDFAPSGNRTLRLETELYQGGEGWVTAQVDGDIDDAVITFTDGTSSLQFTVESAQIADVVPDRITGPGAVVVPVIWTATAADAVTVVLTNANSSAEAA